MKILLLITLVFSLFTNILFLYIDVLPFIKRKISLKLAQLSIKKSKMLDNKELEEQIVKESIKMAKSIKVAMPMSEQLNFIEEIKKIIIPKQKTNNDKFNYPKAYLFAGLTEYAISKQNNDLIELIVEEFDNYISDEGLPIFDLEKVDQIPFGIAAINLYNFLGDKKYKLMSDLFIEKLFEFEEEKLGIVYYRKIGNIDFIDTIGLICPFLVRYGITFSNQRAINLAKKQIEYYIRNGCDKVSNLPSQALIKSNNIKVGSHNWGRGIGWFIVGFSDYLRFTNDSSLLEEFNKLQNTLMKLTTKDFEWSQFPGSSGDFDASSTTMIMYGLNAIKKTQSTKEILEILKGNIINGSIKNTSGDTYYANRFSNTFGDSELSQGFLLMLLSTGIEKIQS